MTWRDLPHEEQERRLVEARRLIPKLGWKGASRAARVPIDALRRRFDEAWAAKRRDQVNRNRRVGPRPSAPVHVLYPPVPGTEFVSASGIAGVTLRRVNRSMVCSSSKAHVVVSLTRVRFLEAELVE